MQAVEITFSYPSYKVPKFHANSRTLSSTTVQSVLPTLTLDARRKFVMKDHRDTRRYQDGGSPKRQIGGFDSTAGPPVELGQSTLVSV